MRVQRIQIEQIGNIQSLSLDLSKFDPGLITITGSNGAGKTHLMECLLYVPLYREFAYYRKAGSKNAKAGESFVDHCGKKSHLEVNVLYGEHDYTLTLKGNKGSRKSEAYVTEDDIPLNPSGRLPEYDGFIEKLFPTKDLMASTIFSGQRNTGSFFDIDREARRTLFARLLGVEEYELWAKDCLEEAKAYIAQVQEWEVERQEIDAFLERTKEAADRCATLMDERDKAAALLQGYAPRAYEALRWQELMTPSIEAGRFLAERIRGLTQNADVYRGMLGNVGQGIADEGYYSHRIERCEALIVTRLSKLYDAETQCDYYRNKSQEIGQWIEELKAKRNLTTRMFDLQVASVKEKIDSLKTTLTATEGVDLRLAICKRCPLTGNANHAKVTYDYLLEEATIAESIYAHALWGFRHAIPDLDDAELTLIGFYNRAIDDRTRWRGAYEAVVAERDYYQSELGKLLSVRESQQEAQEKLLNLQEELFGLEEYTWGDLVEEAYYDGLENFSWNVRLTIDELYTIDTRLSDSYVMLDERRLKHLRAVELDASVAAYLEHATEFQDLNKYLLRMRSAMIEAARPEVEEMANKLLEGYQDGRFRVELEADATRGSKEDFILKIYDSQTGEYRTSGSGGEQAFIDEALRLSFCVLNAKRSGSRFETLFRDETTKELTREYAAAYVDMLRRAQTEGGFHHIIFISHDEAVWSKADVILEMVNGELHER